MTHLPQVKSIRSNVSELGLLLLLDRILHTIPNIIVSNSDRKNLVDRRVEYPAEQRDSSRHEQTWRQENLLTTVYSMSRLAEGFKEVRL